LYEGQERGGERFHGLGLAVNEECVLDIAAGLPVRPGQVDVAGVAGEAVEHVDGGVEFVLLRAAGSERFSVFFVANNGKPGLTPFPSALTLSPPF
jgi:hypothetical protein